MFNKIKKKIKLAKTWAIILWIILIILIINNIYLTYKVMEFNSILNNWTETRNNIIY